MRLRRCRVPQCLGGRGEGGQVMKSAPEFYFIFIFFAPSIKISLKPFFFSCVLKSVLLPTNPERLAPRSLLT